ncbi:dihydrofolate reductase, partial [Peribacillus asahii]|uniref:dihydrofolate reductase n=1 Tax=Peribacillus asahii TaxID=228899 RepID=UPI0038160B79
MIKMIACIDANGGIGKNDKLLTHLPKDLDHFKKTTIGEICVFGRTTYESLPVKPLPHRDTIVLTTDKKAKFEGCKVAKNMDYIIKLSKEHDIYICGGAKIYEQFMSYADELIISHMEESFDADTFFPKISKDIWTPYYCEGVEDKVNFSIIKYKRNP